MASPVLVVLAALVVAVCSSPPVNRNQTVAKTHDAKSSLCVELYVDTMRGGAEKTFCGNVDSLVPYGWNDQASSFRFLCSGCKVDFFDDHYYGGKHQTYYSFSTTWSNFGCGFNDILTSLRVQYANFDKK